MHADEDIHREVGRQGGSDIHIVAQLGGYAGIVELVVVALSRLVERGGGLAAPKQAQPGVTE